MARCRFSCRRTSRKSSSIRSSKAVPRRAEAAISPISTSHPMCASAWATTSPLAATRCAPVSLSIGGMGARSRNFYNDLTKRLGYEAAAVAIQDHFLAGRRNDAAAAVPDALIDEISLVGPPDRIKDRLQAWQALAEYNWVGSLVLAGADAEAMRVVAEAVL